jgi:hypothetical protein
MEHSCVVALDEGSDPIVRANAAIALRDKANEIAVLLAENPPDIEVYYFGCIDQSGHYMNSSTGRQISYRDVGPWTKDIDSGLCPGDRSRHSPDVSRAQQIEGHAALHHKDGWSALSFWDRSVDTRYGCNSNFLAEGTFSFTDMVALAKAKFPNVWNRFKFSVTLTESHD